MAVVDGGNGGSFARVGDGGNASGIGGGKPLPIGVVGWDCELTGEFNWLVSPFAFKKKEFKIQCASKISSFQNWLYFLDWGRV